MSFGCPSCDTTTFSVYDTQVQLKLSCGNIYNMSVRAVVKGISGLSSGAIVRLGPKVGAVTSLQVHVFSVKENNSQNVFGVDEGFLLTWKKPKNAEDIEVSSLSL